MPWGGEYHTAACRQLGNPACAGDGAGVVTPATGQKMLYPPRGLNCHLAAPFFVFPQGINTITTSASNAATSANSASGLATGRHLLNSDLPIVQQVIPLVQHHPQQHSRRELLLRGAEQGRRALVAAVSVLGNATAPAER